jgi:hypothetical protein
MKKVFLERNGETKEAYIACDGSIFQWDPDPKMLGASRIFDNKRQAGNYGWIVVDLKE